VKVAMGSRALRQGSIVATLALLALVLAACASMTGRSAGENVDDAQITTAVKVKLAGEKLATLTRVGVETNLRTVYLTGVVESEAARQRAIEIAWSVKHVNGVISHLTVQKSG
jgi:hyperosmotically inducible periplasmic protein